MRPQKVGHLSLHDTFTTNPLFKNSTPISDVSSLSSQSTKRPINSPLAQRTSSHSMGSPPMNKRDSLKSAFELFQQVQKQGEGEQFQKLAVRPIELNILLQSHKFFKQLQRMFTMGKLVIIQRSFQVLQHHSKYYLNTSIKSPSRWRIENDSYFLQREFCFDNEEKQDDKIEMSFMMKVIERNNWEFCILKLFKALEKATYRRKREIMSDLDVKSCDIIKINFVQGLSILKQFFDKKRKDDRPLIFQFWNNQKVFNEAVVKLAQAAGVQMSMQLDELNQKLETNMMEATLQIDQSKRNGLQLAGVTLINQLIKKKIMTFEHHLFTRIILQPQMEVFQPQSMIIQDTVFEIDSTNFINGQQFYLQESNGAQDYALYQGNLDNELTPITSNDSQPLKLLTFMTPGDLSPVNQAFNILNQFTLSVPNVPKKSSLKQNSPANGESRRSSLKQVQLYGFERSNLLEKIQSLNSEESGTNTDRVNVIDNAMIGKRDVGKYDFLQVKSNRQSQNLSSLQRFGEDKLQDQISTRMDLKSKHLVSRLSSISCNTLSVPKKLPRRNECQQKLLESIRSFVNDTQVTVKKPKDNRAIKVLSSMFKHRQSLQTIQQADRRKSISRKNPGFHKINDFLITYNHQLAVMVIFLLFGILITVNIIY